MLLGFVDETGDRNLPDYFGLTLATINASFYRTVKEQFHAALDATDWDPTVEFKGSYLFSASKGCASVSVEQRIELVTAILKLNTSAKNRRMRFYFASTRTGSPRDAYLAILPLLLKKALPTATRKGGKDLLKLYCDQRSDLKSSDIRTVVAGGLAQRRYTLVEDVVCSVSNRETVGILYADIVGYLTGRAEALSADIDVFADLTPETLAGSPNLRKLQTSTTLLGYIKQFQLYSVVPA